MSRVATLALLILAACGTSASAARGTRDSTSVGTPADTSAMPPVVRDSLVLSGPHEQGVWFTFAREDHAAGGSACVDRAIEIRTGEHRVAVPLLYTEEVPRFINDSTLEASLYRGCAAIALYHVNTRTGQPVPARSAR